MHSRDELLSCLPSQIRGELESPFLDKELLGEEAEPARESRLKQLQSESPFASALESGSWKTIELDVQEETFDEEVEYPISENSRELQEIESSLSRYVSAKPWISEEELSNMEGNHQKETEEKLSECYACSMCNGPMMESSSDTPKQEAEESFDIEASYSRGVPSFSREEQTVHESKAEEIEEPLMEEDESRPSWEMIEEGLASYEQPEVKEAERNDEGFFEDLENQDHIRWVQGALNQAMKLNLLIDGILGPKTLSAIRSFQQSRGLKVDGVVGPITEQALAKAISSAPPSPTTPGTPAKDKILTSPDPGTILIAQMALNALLGLRLVTDGVLGVRTKSALKSFQQRENLPASNQLDNAVMRSLISRVASASEPDSQKCSQKEVVDRFEKGTDRPQDQKAEDDLTKTIAKVALCVSKSQNTSAPIRIIKVVGHASTEGPRDLNMNLGGLRAKKVAQLLAEALRNMVDKPVYVDQPPNRNADAIIITTESHGAEHPTGKGKEQDRRVEIFVPKSPSPLRFCEPRSIGSQISSGPSGICIPVTLITYAKGFPNTYKDMQAECNAIKSKRLNNDDFGAIADRSQISPKVAVGIANLQEFLEHINRMPEQSIKKLYMIGHGVRTVVRGTTEVTFAFGQHGDQLSRSTLNSSNTTDYINGNSLKNRFLIGAEIIVVSCGPIVNSNVDLECLNTLSEKFNVCVRAFQRRLCVYSKCKNIIERGRINYPKNLNCPSNIVTTEDKLEDLRTDLATCNQCPEKISDWECAITRTPHRLK